MDCLSGKPECEECATPAGTLAEAWDAGYRAGMDWEESGGPYSDRYDEGPTNPYRASLAADEGDRQ